LVEEQKTKGREEMSKITEEHYNRLSRAKIEISRKSIENVDDMRKYYGVSTKSILRYGNDKNSPRFRVRVCSLPDGINKRLRAYYLYPIDGDRRDNFIIDATDMQVLEIEK
jgi:hypothetical protein